MIDKLLKVGIRKKEINYYCILLLFVITNIFLKLLGVSFIGNFIDSLVTNNNFSELKMIAISYLVVAVLNTITDIGIVWWTQYLGWETTNRIRISLMEKIFKVDYKIYYENISEIVETMDEDVNRIFNFMSKMGVIVISNIFLYVCIILYFFSKNILMGGVQLGLSLFFLIILKKINRYGMATQKLDRKAESKYFEMSSELIENASSFRISNGQKFFNDSINESIDKWRPIRKKSGILMWSSNMVLLGFQASSYMICFVLGTVLWLNGYISVGSIFMFYQFTRYMIEPISTFQSQLQDFQKTVISLNRIAKLLEFKEYEIAGNLDLTNVTCLEIKSVSFSYNSSVNVLKGISAKLIKGDLLAVIGRTGVGKSTLLRLINNMYSPDDGKLFLNGFEFQEYDKLKMMKNISYLQQESFLFEGSIRENLCMFSNKISDSQILHTIENLGLEDWFFRFEAALDTNILNQGKNLSEGERHLLCLIRECIKDSDLVLIDELTSKLDPYTEELINSAILRLTVDKICVLVAHKLSTAKMANKIMYLDASVPHISVVSNINTEEDKLLKLKEYFV